MIRVAFTDKQADMLLRILKEQKEERFNVIFAFEQSRKFNHPENKRATKEVMEIIGITENIKAARDLQSKADLRAAGRMA